MRRRQVYAVLLCLLVAILLLLAVIEPGTVGPVTRIEPDPGSAGGPVLESKSLKKVTAVPVVPERHGPPAPDPAPTLPGPEAKLAIIIDDVGYHDGLDELAVAIPFPLTFSVLPGLGSSAASAVRLRSSGCEIMLHLPMEPEQYPKENPGPGALFTFMTPDEIRRTVRDDILSVPGARGVNNHMGSLFTVREDLLKVVFEELRRRGLYFIDSRTTTATAAQRVARRLGLRSGRRSVFLDNRDDPTAITAQLEQLFDVAVREGSAVGIGHYRETTLEVLSTEVPRLCRLNPEVKMVYASDVVN